MGAGVRVAGGEGGGQLPGSFRGYLKVGEGAWGLGREVPNLERVPTVNASGCKCSESFRTTGWPTREVIPLFLGVLSNLTGFQKRYVK